MRFVLNPFSGQLIFQEDDDVLKYAESNDKICFIYKENVVDVTSFQFKHPGGQSILDDYNGYDITEVFHDSRVHRHSVVALQELMNKYIVGKVDEEEFYKWTEYHNQKVQEEKRLLYLEERKKKIDRWKLILAIAMFLMILFMFQQIRGL